MSSVGSWMPGGSCVAQACGIDSARPPASSRHEGGTTVQLYGQEAEMAATARLEFRLPDESKARMERAAEIARVPLSDFVRTAAEERTEQVLREHDATITVPAAFFDDLLAALDAPAQADENLAAAFQRSRDLVTRR